MSISLKKKASIHTVGIPLFNYDVLSPEKGTKTKFQIKQKVGKVQTQNAYIRLPNVTLTFLVRYLVAVSRPVTVLSVDFSKKKS